MCECGCVSNHSKYSFPGPGKSFYILSLMSQCVNCDAPCGVTIDLIEPGHILWDEYKRGEFLDGPLEFQQYPDNKGVTVKTGFFKQEFIKAGMPHLVGIGEDMFDEDTNAIDEIGADVILEEMYEDVQLKPTLLHLEN